MPGYGKKMMYGTGGSKMKYKDGGQALFDALKKKGYKKMGGVPEYGHGGSIKFTRNSKRGGRCI